MKLTGKHVNRWDWYAAAAMAVLVVIIFHTFIFTNSMIFGSDMVPMGYMMRQVVADYWREHLTIPAWDPYILGGLPVVDAMHGDIFYPAALLYLFMPLGTALGYKIVIHVWLAGMAMYVLLRVLGLGRRSAFAGGIAYMAAPYLLSLIYAGHDAKMFVTSLFPLCVAGLELLLRHRKYIYAVGLGVLLGLLFLTSHPQMTYFAIWGLAIYAFFNVRRMLSAKALRRATLLVAISLAIGIGMGCIQFLPTYFYTTHFSPRTGGVSFAYAASWSLHPEEIVSLLLPAFVGYSADHVDSYWGRNPFKANAESPGPLVMFLAIGGLVLFLKRRELRAWIFIFFFSVLYALGANTPLLKIAYYAIPGAKFLRAPSLTMFMFSCASAVFAAFFIESLLTRKPSPGQKKILDGLWVWLVATALLFTVGRGALFGAWQSIFGKLGPEKLAVITRSAGFLTRDALLLTLFAGFALLVASTRWRDHMNGGLLLGVCLVGILATSLPHSTNFITYVNDYPGLKNWLKPGPAISYLEQDKSLFRALPIDRTGLYERDYLPIFGVETANGFYDNRNRYFEALTGRNQSDLSNWNIMSITNVKYLVTDQEIDHALFEPSGRFGRYGVYRYRNFLPRTFIVHNAVIVGSDSAAAELIKGARFNPSTTIVLESGQPMTGEAGPGESAEIQTYDPGRVVIKAKAESRGYLFFSENYLPYWKAFVDGRPAPLLRCNVAMRAIPLDPGEHVVEMRFFSKWYAVGAGFFIAACAVVAASVAFEVRRRSRKGGERA